MRRSAQGIKRGEGEFSSRPQMYFSRLTHKLLTVPTRMCFLFLECASHTTAVPTSAARVAGKAPAAAAASGMDRANRQRSAGEAKTLKILAGNKN